MCRSAFSQGVVVLLIKNHMLDGLVIWAGPTFMSGWRYNFQYNIILRSDNQHKQLTRQDNTQHKWRSSKQPSTSSVVMMSVVFLIVMLSVVTLPVVKLSVVATCGYLWAMVRTVQPLNSCRIVLWISSSVS